jgi:hypothetical protein
MHVVGKTPLPATWWENHGGLIIIQWNEGNSAKWFVKSDSPKNNHHVSSWEIPDEAINIIITSAVERMALPNLRRQNHRDISVTSEVVEMSLILHDRVMAVWLLLLLTSTESEDLYLLGYIALCSCLQDASFSLGLLFNSEDADNIFLRNVSRFSTDYTALYPRTLYRDRCENFISPRQGVHIETRQTLEQGEVQLSSGLNCFVMFLQPG